MTINKTLFCAAFVATAIASQPASAGIISISSAVGGTPAYAKRINFDDLALGSGGGTATGPNGSATVTFVSDAQAVTGSLGGQYAAPYLSGNNGVGFGSPDQPNGQDTTTYLTSGKRTSGNSTVGVTIQFSAVQQFLGLLWGSVDAYNTLEFWNGATLVGTVTGAQVIGIPNGDQGLNGTVYVNINADPFNKVVVHSSEYAFELDNVSYNETTVPVPDGGATLALLGLGLSALGILRRKTL